MSLIQSIAGKINQMSGVLTQMQQDGNGEQLGGILQELGQLDAELRHAQAQITPETSEALRQDLVQCRMALHGMLAQVSNIRSDMAERYRQVLGDRKEDFERLDDQSQQNTEPGAYQFLQLFKGMDDVSRHIHQLDGAMMDAGYQLGRGPGGETAVYGDASPEDFTSGTATTDWS